VTDARAVDRFVARGGGDSANDCLSSTAPCGSVGHALAQTASGDTIKVARGAYVEDSLTISGSTTLLFSGGWAADFSAQDGPTTSVRASAGPVFDITAVGTTVDVTLDTLTLHGSETGVVATSGGSGSLTVTLANCRLKNNQNSSLGAGITATSDDSSVLNVIVNDTTFRANRAQGGTAIRTSASGSSSLTVALTRSTFTGNRAVFSGAGLSAVALDTAAVSVSVAECTFKANRAAAAPGNPLTGNGGAIAFAGTSLTVVNSIFRSNRAYRGGALAVSAGSPNGSSTIVNSTFSRNRASNDGGGIDVVSGSSSHAMSLKNTILWGNRAGVAGQDLKMLQFAGPLTVDADHSDIGDRATDSGAFNDLGGNISADPRLTAGLHLRENSPAIDAGTCTGAPATDFDGDTRPTGTGCDIGADEFVP
jgi:hypothetical protein